MSFDPFSFESGFESRFRQRIYAEMALTSPRAQIVLTGSDASKERLAEAIAKAKEVDPEGMRLLAEYIDFGEYVDSERDAEHEQAMRELKDEL